MGDNKLFWIDGPEMQKRKIPTLISISVVAIELTITISAWGLVIFVINLVSHILAWMALVFILLFYAYYIYRIVRRRKETENIPLVQENARKIAGATIIGSAVHVAGHPLLNRDQEVVLALAPEGLKIFPYNDDHPIDILSPERMEKIYTVTYDDERVPHIDVIDSSAQALQITYKEANKEYTCLFRRMRNVRPIDWYHELQKARFGEVQNG